MSLNDPHWGRSSDEEKKNDRGDNEQRSDGVGEDGEEQNARQNPNAQDDRNPADSSADGSRRTSRDAREDDEQRDRRSQGLLSDDDLENLWSNFQQAANKIMGRQGRSNQEDLRSRLKSREKDPIRFLRRRVRRKKHFARASAQRNWPRQTRRLMSGQRSVAGRHSQPRHEAQRIPPE